jgi:hypothetical protein
MRIDITNRIYGDVVLMAQQINGEIAIKRIGDKVIMAIA